MEEIKCPNCGKVFTVNEENYSSIAKQIRDKEFKKDLDERIKIFNSEKAQAIEKARVETENEWRKTLAEKENVLVQKNGEIDRLKSDRQLEIDLARNVEAKKAEEQVAQKDREISSKTYEIERLKAQIESIKKDNAAAIEKAVGAKENQFREELHRKDLDVLAAKNELSNLKMQSDAEAQKIKLQHNAEMQQVRLQYDAETQKIKSEYDVLLRGKDDEIAKYKDFKAKQSVKLLGETLERHCEIEFDKLRTLFKNVYFEKDNDARSGSKGDYIYREKTEGGTEILSIMFEMKNEGDETATKKKNSDFFKELDKDRTEKKCEYAILVTMLEPENELYNGGIVDVSYKYEKMYVIRPQFFIPVITFLHNVAIKNADYKVALEEEKNKNLDVAAFEENLNEFKTIIGRNYKLAGDHYRNAVENIDKTIRSLTKMREELVLFERNMRLANEKTEDLTIKRLTKNCPAVREKFEQSNESESENKEELSLFKFE